VIDKRDLGPLEEISSGTFGVVYRASKFRLPGEPGSLAYKEFTVDDAQQAGAARAVIDLWEQLTPEERDSLAQHTVWPRALVHDGGGNVCGLLMPLLAPEFFHQGPDPKNGVLGPRPRSLEWLVATRKLRSQAGVDVPEVDLLDRKVLLAKLIFAVGRLHRLGWVYGDLSFKNAVFAVDPPRVVLLDCDGAAPLTDSGRVQPDTPFWEPPERVGSVPVLQDKQTDVYKLGLAILRFLTPGKAGGQTRDPARVVSELDDEGKELLRRALGDRAHRPTAKELFLYFERAVQSRITPPVIRWARIATPIRLRGQDIGLAWEIDGAETIAVETANGQRVEVDPATSPAGFWFRPDVSGPVAIEVRNRFGTVWEDLGDITLYELPRFQVDRVDLPRPQFTELDAVTLTTAAAVLDDRPLTRVGVPVTALPPLRLDKLIGSTQPAGGGLPPLPRLSAPVAASSGVVTASVLRGGVGLASHLHDVIADASRHVTTGGRTT
jgi:hypothetical protein